MCQSTQDLAKMIDYLTSTYADDQTRHSTFNILINSFSPEMIKYFIDLIRSKEFPESTKIHAVSIFSDLLKRIELIKKIDDIVQLLIQTYYLSKSLISLSKTIEESRILSTLIFSCISSSITLLSQTNNKLGIFFFKELFEEIRAFSSYPALHGFCFATCDLLKDYSIFDYCDEDYFINFLNEVIAILQRYHDLSGENSVLVNELLNLCHCLIEDDDDAYELFQSNEENFIHSICNFLNYPQTFLNSIGCFSSLVQNSQKNVLPVIGEILNAINNFVKQNIHERNSILCISNFLINFSKHDLFLFCNIDIHPILYVIFGIMREVPFNCDLSGYYEPYDICQESFSNIIESISCAVEDNDGNAEFEPLKNRLLSYINEIDNFSMDNFTSDDYKSRYLSVCIFKILVANLGNKSYFLKVPNKEFLINDPSPRVREMFIALMVEYISLLPGGRCDNENEFAFIQSIYNQIRNIIPDCACNAFQFNENDCFSIAHITFVLLYKIALIPGFDFYDDLFLILMENIQFLNNIHQDDILYNILKMVRNCHIKIMNSFKLVEQKFDYFLQQKNMDEDLISSLIDITYAFVDRFKNKIDIDPVFFRRLFSFSNSLSSCQAAHCIPLIGIITSNILSQKAEINLIAIISPIFNVSISLLIQNNPIYSGELYLFYQSSIFSIMFLKNMINCNLIPANLDIYKHIFDYAFPLTNELLYDCPITEADVIYENLIPFNLRIYALNLVLTISKNIVGLFERIIETYLNNFIPLLNSVNFLSVGKMKRAKLFTLTLETLILILQMKFTETSSKIMFDKMPDLIQNFVQFFLVLRKQSAHNINNLLYLLDYFARFFGGILKNNIEKCTKDFFEFVSMFPPDSRENTELLNIAAAIGIDVFCS